MLKVEVVGEGVVCDKRIGVAWGNDVSPSYENP